MSGPGKANRSGEILSQPDGTVEGRQPGKGIEHQWHEWNLKKIVAMRELGITYKEIGKALGLKEGHCRNIHCEYMKGKDK